MRRTLLIASFSIATACGPHGYASTEHLDARGQGPAGCVERCNELGMQMTALVLVGNEMSGCVCQPIPTSGAIAPSSVTVAAGAVLQLEQQRRIAAAAAAARRTAVR